MNPPPEPPSDPRSSGPMWDQLFELEGSRRPSGLPRRVRPGRGRRIALAAAAGAVAVIAVVALVFWLLRPAHETDSAATRPSQTADPQAQLRLHSLLPAGYTDQSCKPVPAPRNALAQMSCGQNSDPGGPPSATYTLLKDKAALSAAFDSTVAASSMVVCPGRIQSPGPWRRNATPDQISGILFCGVQQGRPLLAWTDDADLLLSEIRAEDQRPAFPELYTWWSSHS
ncbi:hypothetical protein ACWDTP_35265 [Mycobacterium sp. NPDC003449]